MLLRIDKILTNCGVCSRSEAEKLIRVGAVLVNGVPVKSRNDKFDVDTITLTVSGEEISCRSHICIMINKPAGVLSATKDGKQRTVLDLLSGRYAKMRLFPIGRLDKDTEGLLLLTDDGQLSHNVISPKKNIDKLYFAEIDGTLTETDVAAFAEGLVLGDGTKCLPACLELAENGVFVTVREGKYHQVKRMIASRGAHVTKLKRLSIGKLTLDESLVPGEYRELSENEIQLIFL